MTRREEMTGECVFCTRRDQPATLFETHSLYVMPDKFPLRRGHVLIIPKDHHRCYAAMPVSVLRELDEAAARVRRFLEQTSGGPVLANETGVVGQTVFHAHLHLTPMPNLAFPSHLLTHDDVTSVEDWQAVREYYARHGHYYYLELGGKRYVVASIHSPVIQELRHVAAQATGLALSEYGFLRATTSDDVWAVERRWREWVKQDQAPRSGA